MSSSARSPARKWMYTACYVDPGRADPQSHGQLLPVLSVRPRHQPRRSGPSFRAHLDCQAGQHPDREDHQLLHHQNRKRAIRGARCRGLPAPQPGVLDIEVHLGVGPGESICIFYIVRRTSNIFVTLLSGTPRTKGRR